MWVVLGLLSRRGRTSSLLLPGFASALTVMRLSSNPVPTQDAQMLIDSNFNRTQALPHINLEDGRHVNAPEPEKPVFH